MTRKTKEAAADWAATIMAAVFWLLVLSGFCQIFVLASPFLVEGVGDRAESWRDALMLTALLSTAILPLLALIYIVSGAMLRKQQAHDSIVRAMAKEELLQELATEQAKKEELFRKMGCNRHGYPI